MTDRNYFNCVAVAFSRLVNAIFGGSPEEMLSTRLYKSNCSVCKGLCAVLSVVLFDPNHCRNAYEADKLWRGEPPSNPQE